MATFKTKTRIKKDGKEYLPGDTIELSPKEAKAMPWAVEPAPAQPSGKNGNGGDGKSQEAK